MDDKLPIDYSQRRYKYEKRFNTKCVFNLTTPQIKANNKKMGDAINKKMVAAEFPLVSEIGYAGEAITKSITHCVFLGTLYSDIRPPEKIVELISKIKEKGILFEFFGYNQSLISSSPFYKIAKNKIVLHGCIPNEEAVKRRLDADVLINIDNTRKQQVPSKIIEYICTGKPIINFYFKEESETLNYLKRYPLVLNVNLNAVDYNEAAGKIETFIKSTVGKSVPYEIIQNEYIKLQQQQKELQQLEKELNEADIIRPSENHRQE